jgi:hypothetical protein
MTTSYKRFSGVCGILAGLAGLLYLVLFIVYRNPAVLLPTLALLAVGLLASPLLVGLYLHLRTSNEGFALLGLLFGIGGAGGAAVHAAFDLSNNLHPPATPFDYPSPVDPRGFLTFLVAGLAIMLFSGLITSGGLLPRGLGYLGWVSGGLLVALYLAYLVILNATNPIVLFLIFASGVLQPFWYLWAGWHFWQGKT